METSSDLRDALTRVQSIKNIRSREEFVDAISMWESLLSRPDLKTNAEIYRSVLKDFGEIRLRGFIAFGSENDLEQAIALLHKAASLKPINIDSRDIFENLGIALGKRYSFKGLPSDLDAAIEASKMAMSLTSEDSPDMPRILNNISIDLKNRYFLKRNRSDLDDSVFTSAKAVTMTENNSPDMPLRLGNMGAGVLELYHLTGEPNFLDSAIGCWMEELRLLIDASPDSSPHPLVPSTLNNLGLGLRERYQLGKSEKLEISEQATQDLDNSIEYLETALKLTPEDSTDRQWRLNNLAISLSDRYDLKGNFADLEKAIELWRISVDITPSGSPDLISKLGNLGSGLRKIYESTADQHNIEEAIDLCRRAFELSKGSALEPQNRSNLASALLDRYIRVNDHNNLEEAIDLLQGAVNSLPKSAIDRPRILNNLAGGLKYQFEKDSNIDDLINAIKACRESVELTKKNAPELPSRLNTLGLLMTEKYSITKNDSDLDQAIEVLQRSIEIFPGKSLQKGIFCNSLGNALSKRYDKSKRPEDLDNAIYAWQEAIRLIPVTSPALLAALVNLGSGIVDRYDNSKDLHDLEMAFMIYQEARDIADGSFSRSTIIYKLGLRKEWSRIDDRIVEIALQLAKYSPEDQNTHWTREALVGAEGAKSRILTELLGRGDLTAPLSIPRSLAEEEVQIITRLVDIDTEEFANQGLLSASEEPSAARLSRIKERNEFVQKLNDLWSQMEILSEEAANFVNLRRGKRPSWEDLNNLAKEVGYDSVITSMFILEDKLLLFVLKGEWKYPEVIEVSIAEKFFIDPKMITRPLFEKIHPYLNGVRNVIMSPYGVGHSLPWAALAKEANLNLPWVSVPSLWSLKGIIKRSYNITGRPLVIGNPIGDLHYAENEAKILADRLNTTPFIGSRATKEMVMEILPKARIAHFATHAYFNPNDPLDSGIVLANGVLTAREIMEIGARPELLVLSACETGITTSVGGDEMMGLSQAFLQAGTKSLLVSLWKVDDESTGVLMENFYNLWIGGNDKAEALGKAMDTVRENEKWSNMSYWGAFNLIGDWKSHY